MQSLKEVIAALREEVESAVADNKPLPGNVQLQAERVVVTLGFSIEKKPGQPLAFDFGTDSVTNNLSIEFRYNASREQTAAETAGAFQEKNKAALSGKQAELVTQQLSQIFGKPGFDSSARATVFREAFENLSDAEVPSLIESFSAPSSQANSDSVKRSLGLIRRVCEAGPAGFANGKKILAKVFAEHAAAPVIELVAQAWKTQQDWMS